MDEIRNAGFIDDETLELLRESLKSLAETICEVFYTVVREILKTFQDILNFYMLKRLRRCRHLAFHSKKRRIRKKNIRRLLREMS